MQNFYDFLRKKWSEYSTASGQKGTVIDELAVKPTGLVMGDFYNSLVDQRRVNDISQWQSWTEDEMDFFGGKFFLPRISGDYAYGFIRIWFDEKVNITFSADARALSISGFKFKAIQPSKISRSSFIKSTDSFASYYIDIQIIAETKGNEYNAEIGEITQLEGVDFTYKMVSNPEAIKFGSIHEDNAAYYNRLIYSISDRSMMNKRSMLVRLPEFFPVISSMHISNPGDRYMIRDLVSGADISRPPQKADYLGKTSGENLVKHIAFYDLFPPTVDSLRKQDWGPFSIKTEYPYPLTIEASETAVPVINKNGQTGDPAFYGYDLTQEFTDDMYKNLFFDDLKLSTEITTTDLFNIQDMNVGFTPVVTPDSTWVYGSVDKKRGNMGELADGVQDVNVINFNNNEITLAGGALNSVSVGKDIGKRIGIKLSGKLVFPEYSDPGVKNSNLQIMVGGVNSENVDGYTGIGFGIHFRSEFVPEGEAETTPLPTNAVVYFAHSEKYGAAQVFGADEDFSPSGHISVTDMGALAEKLWRIQPGVEYDFEFIIHDDLKLTLYLNKNDQRLIVDDAEEENNLHFSLRSTVLNVYSQELFNKNTTHYGTTMKMTLDTLSTSTSDQWIIRDLKAFDTQDSKATALFAINVKGIEDPISVYLRAFGYSAVNGTFSEGYSAYIWDKEIQTIASGESELTRGGWAVLDKVSNPNGSINVLNGLPRHDLTSLNRYRVNSRFGENIFIMLAASGTSKSNSVYFGSTEGDIHSRLQIDYVKLQSQSTDMYHANNKADIYVSTVKNTESLEVKTAVIEKSSNDSYFEMNSDNSLVPIENIISVTLGTQTAETEALSTTEYSVVRPDANTTGSKNETVRIILDNSNSNIITVEYTTYPEVSRIQDFFDGTEYGKIYGDILIKHKVPAYLSFIVYYTGNTNEEQFIDEIKSYIDANIDGTFSVREMVNYLYENKLANSVTEPIEITYSTTDDDGRQVTGKFSDKLSIRPIDYFRVLDLSVKKL